MTTSRVIIYVQLCTNSHMTVVDDNSCASHLCRQQRYVVKQDVRDDHCSAVMAFPFHLTFLFRFSL